MWCNNYILENDCIFSKQVQTCLSVVKYDAINIWKQVQTFWNMKKLMRSQISSFGPLPFVYRVSHKYLDDFLKMVVAFKWVKPCLINFLCFLSILIANFSENFVAIASFFLFVHGLTVEAMNTKFWQYQLSAFSPERAVLKERVHDCWCGAQWGPSYSDFAIAASNNSVNCSTIESFRAYLDTI